MLILNNTEVYYCGLFFIYVIFSVVRRADCERSAPTGQNRRGRAFYQQHFQHGVSAARFPNDFVKDHDCRGEHFYAVGFALAMPALTGNISVLETVGDTPAESTPVADANVDANANAAIDANANTANINNLPSNVIVVTNTNSTADASNTAANATSNVNAAAKIDEPKPPIAANANR